MPKLLQINVVSNMLSTGKICEDIAKVVKAHGWETYMAYGRWGKPSVSEVYRIGNNFDMYLHYAEHRLFDREGLSSRKATKNLVKWIDEVKPDIIHLHNIHDHYLNYPILFEYLAKVDIPVVWTQHDCWAFTGGCTYFDKYDYLCDKWKEGCESCPDRRAFFCNKSEYQYSLKKKLMQQVKSLTFVPVSDWLGYLIKESFHANREVITIHNGIDISCFKPAVHKVLDGKFRILGVAAVWHKRKGLEDFVRLREKLPEDFEITLVGLTQKQVDTLPKGINGISRTSNIEAMVMLYCNADVFVNPTYSDNFPTTNIEALACGTPVVTYRTGGSPEAIDQYTGVVIKQGNLEELADAIMNMKNHRLSSKACRRRAEEYFDKDNCFEAYLNLYNRLINK